MEHRLRRLADEHRQPKNLVESGMDSIADDEHRAHPLPAHHPSHVRSQTARGQRR